MNKKLRTVRGAIVCATILQRTHSYSWILPPPTQATTRCHCCEEPGQLTRDCPSAVPKPGSRPLSGNLLLTPPLLQGRCTLVGLLGHARGLNVDCELDGQGLPSSGGHWVQTSPLSVQGYCGGPLSSVDPYYCPDEDGDGEKGQHGGSKTCVRPQWGPGNGTCLASPQAKPMHYRSRPVGGPRLMCTGPGSLLAPSLGRRARQNSRQTAVASPSAGKVASAPVPATRGSTSATKGSPPATRGASTAAARGSPMPGASLRTGTSCGCSALPTARAYPPAQILARTGQNPPPSTCWDGGV